MKRIGGGVPYRMVGGGCPTGGKDRRRMPYITDLIAKAQCDVLLELRFPVHIEMCWGDERLAKDTM